MATWVIETNDEARRILRARLNSEATTTITLGENDSMRFFFDRGPFDYIILSYASRKIPLEILTQLSDQNGKLICGLSYRGGSQLLVSYQRLGDFSEVLVHETIHLPVMEIP